MGDHVPLAKRAGAEVDAFANLWRTRRWLAIVLLAGLVIFGVWSITSNWIKAREIDQLKAEKNRLEAALRETERENRGLRETVAPLLARAAREFPGEEINTSLTRRSRNQRWKLDPFQISGQTRINIDWKRCA